MPASLLDGTGRRIIVQDRTAAVEVLLPSGATAPRPGSRLRIDGEMGIAYGAPRIRAESIIVIGTAALPAARDLVREPGSADECELVRVTGRVVDLRRLGDRWRAELKVAAATVVIAGLAGAGIPAASMPEGASVEVVGVVRRPHPAATDRRFAIVPRSPADVRIVRGATSTAADGGASAPSGAAPTAGTPASGPAAATSAAAIDADLAALPAVGTLVRVGGLVVAVDGTSVLIDDGTATASLRLAGDAAELLGLLEPGDAVSAVGRVAEAAGGAVVEVSDAAGLVRVGDLGEALPLAADVAPTEAGEAAGRPAGAVRRRRGHGRQSPSLAAGPPPPSRGPAPRAE